MSSLIHSILFQMIRLIPLFYLFFSLTGSGFARVNAEREIKRIVRPFGYVATEVKKGVQRAFINPEKNYNYVRGNTFSQTHLARGRIGRTELGAALPHRKILGQFIKVYYPPTGKSIRLKVKDVGPYFSQDNYWESQRRPYVETVRETPLGEPIHDRAAISLTPQAWYKLGVRRNLAFTGGFQGVVGWRVLGKPIGHTHGRNQYRGY